MARAPEPAPAATRGGRTNQKERTRRAILDAARTLIDAGGEATMPDVARTACVSEATAYRYFPDLPTLLREAMHESWPGATQIMAPLAEVTDPAERVAHATEHLLRHVLTHAPAVRATMAAAIVRPADIVRPAYRLGLIEAALAPLTNLTPETLTQMRQDLAVIMSAEAFFTLTDICGMSSEEAIASVVASARCVTMARLR
jgi:AcrR family transcriptional regulator